MAPIQKICTFKEVFYDGHASGILATIDDGQIDNAFGLCIFTSAVMTKKFVDVDGLTFAPFFVSGLKIRRPSLKLIRVN